MHFTAAVSGDSPITYTWDFDNDGTPEQSDTGLDTISYSYDTAGTYTVTLDVANDCPSTYTLSITVTVVAPPPKPEPDWEKLVAVNDVLTDTGTSITVWPSDTVQIVDRVYVTHTDNVTFTLVETWTASLALTGSVTETGEVTLGDHTLTWHASGVAPHTWHAITKTFTVLSGTWQTDRVTESLWVAGAVPQLADQVLTFEHGAAGPWFSVYLPLVLRND
jgi:PKD repeat protein